MTKVTVDHTGKTGEYYYTKGVEVELPDETIEALGESATAVEGETKKAPVKKEVKKVQNKMVQRADATTKDDDSADKSGSDEGKKDGSNGDEKENV